MIENLNRINLKKKICGNKDNIEELEKVEEAEETAEEVKKTSGSLPHHLTRGVEIATYFNFY